ncbi:hypothetical protein XU18_4389 [Perkinsela sp. CCAP 1560/4]|nr:hypothetical protein XU18_4389 [Perkinsela sp. CCAP 1560/4]|eukprot:KNH04330.1 hypothetical protein XU18_4389 [Perkinsela sp. CCAP 1560/4]
MRIRVERHVQFSNCAIKTKQKNHLSGTLDLQMLGECMIVFMVHTNHLSGSLNLTKLPHSLGSLHLHTNRFTRIVIVGALPDSASILLRNNPIDGVCTESGVPFSDPRIP